MNREWWTPVVQWMLWGCAMTVVMGWIARSRMRVRSERERDTLVHPTSTLIIGLVGAVFFFGIAVISNTFGKNATATIWTTLTFVAAGIASLLLVLDYLFARHRVSDQGIEFGRMSGQRGSVLWSDVEKIRYAPVLK